MHLFAITTSWAPGLTSLTLRAQQNSDALLANAQASLDEAILNDPILAPATLAALLDFEAGQLVLPPEAVSATTVLANIQVGAPLNSL